MFEGRADDSNSSWCVDGSARTFETNEYDEEIRIRGKSSRE